MIARDGNIKAGRNSHQTRCQRRVKKRETYHTATIIQCYKKLIRNRMQHISTCPAIAESDHPVVAGQEVQLKPRHATPLTSIKHNLSYDPL